MRPFVPVPAGEVLLRDARRGEERTVRLLPFELGRYAITAEELAAGGFAVGGRRPDGTEGLPAAGVRWIDAVTWCNAASLADGLEPAYVFSGGSPTWRPAADGYRLPTEAEWVHACRAGSTGPRYGELAAIGWSADDGVSGPQPVGLKDANPLGFHDMIGNVWEWCWDRLDPARYGDYRLLKGGGWADPKWSCRVGVRRGDAPDARLEDTGFRVARGAAVETRSEAAQVPAHRSTRAPELGAQEWQGWSERADRARASASGPLPVGWTPLR